MHEGFPGKVENCGQGSSSTFTLITRTASGRPKLKQRHYHWNWNAVGLSYRKNRSYHIRDFCVCGLGSDLVSPTEGTQTNGHSSCCLYQLAATRQRPRHSLAHSFIHSLTGPLRHVSVQVGLARLSLRSSWWVSTHTHSPIHPPTSITPIGLVLWRALALWLHGCALLLSPGKAIVCVRKYWVCAWKISYLNNNSIFIYFHLCCEVELVFFLNQSHVLLLSFYWFCVAATPVTWLWIDSRVIHFSPLLTAPLAGCVFFYRLSRGHLLPSCAAFYLFVLTLNHKRNGSRWQQNAPLVMLQRTTCRMRDCISINPFAHCFCLRKEV